MWIHKITTGYVVQRYDHAGKCVSQEFIAGDETEVETSDGEPIDDNLTLEYMEFDMVQPE